MDVSGLASVSTALSQGKAADAVSVLVQKKAMDAEAKSAAALLQALPKPASNPAHLGQNVDTSA